MGIISASRFGIVHALQVAKAARQTTWEATILLYAPALDRHLEAMAEYADRVFFSDMQRSGRRLLRSFLAKKR
jgi:hypothetical protein